MYCCNGMLDWACNPTRPAQVIKESVGLVMSLMREWGVLAAADRAASQFEAPLSAGGAAGVGSSLHRVEGAALALLCSHDVAVRK
jgi:hypothetical protein